MKNLFKVAVVGSVFMPFLALATEGAPPKPTEATDLFTLMGRLNEIVNVVIPFIIGLAVLVIIWGVFNFISGAGDEEKRAEAKQYIIWGIIGLFIMTSVWGLVNILSNTFKFDQSPDAAPIVNPNSLYEGRITR